MSVDVFQVHCGALSGIKLVGFRGNEVMNRPYEFEVFFTVPHGTDPKPGVGAKVAISGQRASDATPHVWHGTFAKIRLLHQAADRSLFVGLMVPKHWFLRHSVRNYVHTKAKMKDFLEKTMKQGGLSATDFEFGIGSYPEEEFVAQYRESHLDFVHRWLEREGAYYFFEHEADEGGAEKMRIVDTKNAHDKLSGTGRVRYFPTVGFDGSSGECFRELHVDYSLLPASVLITDYNYANPAATIDGSHAVSATGRGELREYGYRVFDAGEAARLAEVKAQSIACRELVLHTMGNVLGLRVGYTFELEDGPAEIPTKWLVVEAKHTAVLGAATPIVARQTGLESGETYRVEIVAIPADVQFRAPQSTPWPRIYGFENGTVDGSATSQYAQIDDQGRYLVRFHFDASDLADGSTSTYMRMIQPHGGSVEGFHFPLRKGTEVVVGFLGGDPDRPAITGVAPNAHRPSTVTNKNHTYNVLRTGGSNHMVIEDQEGAQHIDLFCPHSSTNFHMGGPATHAFSQPPKQPGEDITFAAVKCDLYLFTEGSGGMVINGDWWENVGNNYWKDVAGTATIHYSGIHSLNIDSDSNEFYNAHQNITVHSGRKDVVEGGGMHQTITAGFTQIVTSGGGKQDVTGGWTHKVSSLEEDKYGTWDTHVDNGWTADVGANIFVKSGGVTTLKAKTEIVLDAPKVSNKATGQWFKTTGFAVELFGSKNSAGIQKFDATAVAIAANGMKRELTANATAATATKTEFVGSSYGFTGTKFEAVGEKTSLEGMEDLKAALSLRSGAFESIMKGVIKVG